MKNQSEGQLYTAFEGTQCLARGPLAVVLVVVKRCLHHRPQAQVLIFSDLTGKQMDFDLSGTEKEILQRVKVLIEPSATSGTSEVQGAASPGPGRPRLGVVAREVSLLPRHWDWLATQSGGASAVLRRLIEDARKGNVSAAMLAKQSQERAHKFMSALAGDLPGFEEALRALYARDSRRFKSRLADWPKDVREYAGELAQQAF